MTDGQTEEKKWMEWCLIGLRSLAANFYCSKEPVELIKNNIEKSKYRFLSDIRNGRFLFVFRFRFSYFCQNLSINVVRLTVLSFQNSSISCEPLICFMSNANIDRRWSETILLISLFHLQKQNKEFFSFK